MSFLKRFVQRQTFHPTPVGIIINPYYIYRRRINREIKGAAASVSGKLLDVGCGSKPYESYFSNVSSYIGLDIDVSGHPDERKKADFFYDGTVMPFRENEFDVILCSEVIEHVFDADALLLEMARVLKPNGTLIITVPFAFPEHEAPYDFKRYTSFGIIKLLDENGFEAKSLNKIGGTLSAIGQLISDYWFNISKYPVVKLVCQIFICFPTSVVFEALEVLLPKDDRIFCGLRVVSSLRENSKSSGA